MSEIIEYKDIEVGDTIRVTLTPKDEPGYMSMQQGVVAGIQTQSINGYSYIEDKYGNTLADQYSDDDEAVIELVDRPKAPLKVGDVISMKEFKDTPYGTVGVATEDGYVWPVWHGAGAVNVAAGGSDALEEWEVTILRVRQDEDGY